MRVRKKIKWGDFYKGPKHWPKEKEFRVIRKDGYSLEVKVKDDRQKVKSKPGTCYICARKGKRLSVKYTIPFNGKFMPGWYCRKCRFKYDILDLMDAKRYQKL